MTASPPAGIAPSVEMVPFPQVEELPPLPPAPGDQPISRRRMRAAYTGQAIAVLGALLLVTSLFIGGWDHVRHIEVTLGDRQMNDSYIGDALQEYTNSYSLAVWAFLKRGAAIPVVVTAFAAAAMSLLAVGRRQRPVVALVVPFALAAGACIALDLRQLPATITGMAAHFPAFPSAVRIQGLRPGQMMLLAIGGLTLQTAGALVSVCCLPRAPRRSRAQRQPKRKQQAVHQLQPRGAGEHAVQGTPTLAAYEAAGQWHREGQGAQSQ